MWKISSGLHFCSDWMSLRFYYGGEFYYRSLGDFDFVESEQMAYRGIYAVSGNELGAEGQFGLFVKPFLFGFSGAFRKEEVGVLYQQSWLNPSFFCAWECGQGELSVQAKIQEGFFSTECTGVYGWFYQKLFLCFFLSYQQNVQNSVVKLSSFIETSGKSLRIGITFKQGLICMVYDNFTFSLRKKIGDFECRASFSPSFIGNNLFQVGVCYYLENAGKDFDLY